MISRRTDIMRTTYFRKATGIGSSSQPGSCLPLLSKHFYLFYSAIAIDDLFQSCLQFHPEFPALRKLGEPRKKIGKPGNGLLCASASQTIYLTNFIKKYSFFSWSYYPPTRDIHANVLVHVCRYCVLHGSYGSVNSNRLNTMNSSNWVKIVR